VNVKNRHSASHDEQRSGTMKSDTRAIPAADPNNRLEYMKAIVQTANVEAETIPLSGSVLVCRVQPAAGCAFGLAGSMVCCLVQRVIRRFETS
jgi:hypothetical protein